MLEPASEPPRILVVEDEPLVASYVETLLKDLGYTVVGIVDSGERAVSKTQAEQPDLVLMDIRLRGEMDGIQAAEKIHLALAIPSVYLTAYTDEATLARVKAGPFPYLVKPIARAELNATLRAVLATHKPPGAIR